MPTIVAASKLKLEIDLETDISNCSVITLQKGLCVHALCSSYRMVHIQSHTIFSSSDADTTHIKSFKHTHTHTSTPKHVTHK